MRWFYKLSLRLRSLFRKSHVERELTDELRFHLEKLTEERVAKGMTREDARYAALREFGGVEQVKAECRDVRGVNFIETTLQDGHYGVRVLARNRCFAIFAVITLALGIGANTAVFTIVNAILLQPLPYPDSGRIMNISTERGGSVTVPMFTYWRQNNPGFQDLAAYADQAYPGINLTGGDKPVMVWERKVSRNYFRLFGANPILGRTFTAEEDRPGGPKTLVISYGLWQRDYGGDPKILGKDIALGGAPYTVIGILSPHFKPYPRADVWTPLQADPSSTAQEHVLTVAGRLPHGTTLAEAASWMKVLGKRYVQAHPEQLGDDDKLQVTPMEEAMTGDVRPSLLILLGAVALVLLIACANVANLLLARAVGRQREIAVRVAVGAVRGRIVRQLLTESLLLSVVGGAVGLALGSWALRALLVVSPIDLPMFERIQEVGRVPALDPWVAGFTILLSMVTGVVFGLMPALRLSRTDLASTLKESGGHAGIGLRHNRLRGALVAAEVAITLVLLSGAVLLIRSLAALHRVQPGLDPQNLLTMRVALAGRKYAKASVVDLLARQTEDRVARVPGVQSAAMASSLPFGPISDMVFDIPGRPPADGRKFTGDVLWCLVSSHYFGTLRIPLRAGRPFREQEPAHTVIINEAMARKFWPKQNPVGQSIVIGAGLGPALDQGSTEIVGVVGDVHDRLDIAPPSTMYQLWSEVPDAGLRLISGLFPASIAVRTKAGVAPLSVSKAVEQSLLEGELQLPATQVESMEQVIRDSTGETNFDLLLLGVFAAVALLLAAVGIYGVMSYAVEQRTHEIGIRMALGARREDILKLVVVQTLKLTLVGLGIGLAGALGLTRFLSSLLYGVKPSDPLTFFAVSLLLAAVALFATYLPARRATKVDPMVALRYE
jgi:predicted permease